MLQKKSIGNIIISSMEGNTEDSASMAKNDPYRGMERSDVRPDFLGATSEDGEGSSSGVKEDSSDSGSEARDLLRGNEEEASSEKSGGSAGESAKTAERASATRRQKSAQAVAGAMGGKAGGKMSALKMLKKGLPILIVIGILISFAVAVISFTGQSFMMFAIAEQLILKYNSTAVTSQQRSDVLLNMQLSKSRSNGSSYGATAFDSDAFGMTVEQQRSLAEYGVNYTDQNGARALTFTGSDGEKYVVVSDDTLSTADGMIALAEGVTEEAGSDEELINEIKRDVLARLEIADADEGNVISVSAALKRIDFKDLYYKGSLAWRGNISGWFNSQTEATYDRLGISRNRYVDYDAAEIGTYEKREKAFEDASKISGPAELSFEDGSETLSERLEKIKNMSPNNECGAASAIMDLSGAVAAAGEINELDSTAAVLEATQKTQAGRGNEAPLDVIANKMTEQGIGGSSAMTAESMRALFSSSGNIDQSDPYLLEVSTEANSVKNVNFGAGVDQGEYAECMYVDNVIEDKKGLISLIGSAFKKAWAAIKNFFGGSAGGATEAVIAALDPTIEKYNTAVERNYLAEDTGKPLGESVIYAGEKTLHEVAKGYGQTTMDEEEYAQFVKVYNEVVAERADYERRNLSPFDTSSRYTFLGSLAYTIVPLIATSETTYDVASIVGKLSSLTGNAVSSLLPTSSAITLAETLDSFGQCAVTEGIGTNGNGRCLQAHGTDFDLIKEDPIALFEYIAGVRYDYWSYVRVKNDNEGSSHDMVAYDGVLHKKLYDAAGPVNPEEEGMALHWSRRGEYGEGEPHGCQYDWEHETRYWNNDPERPYKYYFWDKPLAWKYTRATNFKYKGYVNGNAEDELASAVNDEDPGGCVLDMDFDSQNNPIINPNSSLGLYILTQGHRDSNYGQSDQNVAQRVAETEYNFGRVAKSEKTNGQAGDAEGTAQKENRSKRIGGSAYVATSKNDQMYMDDEMGEEKDYYGELYYPNFGWVSVAALSSEVSSWHFWQNENRYYQQYMEWQDLLETTGVLGISGITTAMTDYYTENPLDQSYEGRIARFAGLSKDEVVEIIALLNYVEWLAEYDPSDLGPMPVQKNETDLQYENTEVIAAEDGAIVAEKWRAGTRRKAEISA